MKLGKRTAAIVLSLMMVLMMMPSMAFAEGEPDIPEGLVMEDAAAEAAADEEPAAEEEPSAEEEEPAAAEIDEPVIEVPADEEEEAIEEEPAAGEEPDAPEESADAPEEDFDDAVEVEIDGSDDTEEDAIPEDGDFGEGEQEISIGIDDADEFEETDPVTQAEAFMYDDVLAKNGRMSSQSVKGDRLSGKDKKFYDAFKSIIKKVSAASTSGSTIASSKNYSLKHFAGRNTFTAKQLGVSRIGYVKNGRWHITSEAQKKIDKLFMPKDWKRIYGALISDLSNQSFWVNWYDSDYTIYSTYSYRYNANKITFYDGYVHCRLAVQDEFQGSKYHANKSKIKGVQRAKDYARSLVKGFDDVIPTMFAGYSDEMIDYNRLWNYCRYIAGMNTYNHAAANADYDYYSYKGAWSWVYVFDQNSGTNVVCAGYARAFKYLCDLSKFKSNWIDCQIVSGKAGTGPDSQHMWNIVRMYDGLNYVVDPTWMDMDDGTYNVNDAWFLRGAPNGTANGYTIEGNVRSYDDRTKKAFASAERKLSAKSYYEIGSSREITLKKTKITKLTKGSRSFKVKWSKVSTPLGALYIDGYQIQYGTKKSMKGAKKVKVKGYNHTSKTVKKLRRGKKYYVRVRTYAKVGNKTYYSKWSKKKAVRVR